MSCHIHFTKKTRTKHVCAWCWTTIPIGSSCVSVHAHEKEIPDDVPRFAQFHLACWSGPQSDSYGKNLPIEQHPDYDALAEKYGGWDR